MKKVLFTGGGSAGHVIPNLALIEELLSQGKIDVCYMGSEGIEKKLLLEKHIPYYTIECPKLVRDKNFTAIKNNLRIPCSFQKDNILSLPTLFISILYAILSLS